MIKRFSLFTACFAFILTYGAFCAQAEQNDSNYSSLFFSPDELKQIETETQNKFGKEDPNTIHLGAILFYSPGKWAVWLQGERWTPVTNYPNLHIIDVNSEMVRLSVTSEIDGTNKEVILRPNQSYNLFSDKVSEGGN